jgi:predicted nucleic acid-binding protein
MEAPVLIDSNVYIDLLRARKDPLLHLSQKVRLENVLCCGVVKSEVLRGIPQLKARNRLEAFFAITQMVATSAKLWEEVWQLAWKLDRQGRCLPLTDIIIASCALREGAAVMTSDRHFEQIPGLMVIRPDLPS